MKKLLGLWLFSLSALGAQAPYMETFKPSEALLLLGIDRTASQSNGDVAKGMTAPELTLNFDGGWYVFPGLFAGGKIRVRAASYQMWLLANPNATRRREIPANTESFTGRFEVQFLKDGQVFGRQTVTPDQVTGRVEREYCPQCNDKLNPAFAILSASPLEVPAETTAVRVALLKTVNLSTGAETTPSPYAGTVNVYYRSNPSTIHVRGRDSLEPYNTNKGQFWIMESGRLPRGSAVEIEPESILNSRGFGLIWGNTPVRAAYEQTPVCYDRKHPNKAHFSNGNDVRAVKRTLHYRIDGGTWQTLAPTTKGTFEIPPVQGARLEIAYEFQFVNDLEKGLYDINRCYQIGSDFEWVPVQPGVKQVPLGTFYDSPDGNLTRGWEILLDP